MEKRTYKNGRVRAKGEGVRRRGRSMSQTAQPRCHHALCDPSVAAGTREDFSCDLEGTQERTDRLTEPENSNSSHPVHLNKDSGDSLPPRLRLSPMLPVLRLFLPTPLLQLSLSSLELGTIGTLPLTLLSDLRLARDLLMERLGTSG